MRMSMPNRNRLGQTGSGCGRGSERREKHRSGRLWSACSAHRMEEKAGECMYRDACTRACMEMCARAHWKPYRRECRAEHRWAYPDLSALNRNHNSRHNTPHNALHASLSTPSQTSHSSGRIHTLSSSRHRSTLSTNCSTLLTIHPLFTSVRSSFKSTGFPILTTLPMLQLPGSHMYCRQSSRSSHAARQASKDE